MRISDWSSDVCSSDLLIRGVADGITKRFDDFVAAEMADTGQPRSMMAHAFIPRGAANFKVFADVVKNVATVSFQTPTPDGPGAIHYSIRKPTGETGVISSWNRSDKRRLGTEGAGTCENRW